MYTTVPDRQRRNDTTVSGELRFWVSIEKGAGSEHRSFSVSSESVGVWDARRDVRRCA